MSTRYIADYPLELPADGRPGCEQRITIDGVPLWQCRNENEPLVSIITVVYNNSSHIARAVQSVLAQSYRNIEYIVIDGGSVDGTVDIIRQYGNRLSYWHSARDNGISDAFNAGVAVARGHYIGLVNSDDWMSPDQVERGVQALKSSGAPFVFGDLIYHRRADGVPAYRVGGDPSYAKKLWHRMPQFTHPTALVKREVYENHGLFDLSWKIGMDYDWLYRLYRAGVVGVHNPAIVGHMSLGGVSDSQWRKCLTEHLKIGISHGSPAAVLKALYLFRFAKTRSRQILEYFVPQKMVLKLRQMLNPAISGYMLDENQYDEEGSAKRRQSMG